MAAKARSTVEALVALMSRDATRRLVRAGDRAVLACETGAGTGSGSGSGAGGRSISAASLRGLLARGLLVEAEPGCFAASPHAAAWLKRRQARALPFREQHGDVAPTRAEPGSSTEVLMERDESPVAALARRKGEGGKPYLAPFAVAAAERLRRDFERGQLQPRVTANWSASVASGRRSGDAGGMADLTEAALAARLRFDAAMRAVGPELSGVLVDVCCFLKGLEAVERERQWPARSAKLVLKLALEGLARHYGLAAEASGGERSGRLRHWGAEDFRPEVS